MNIPYREFWILPIGVFNDMVACYQIMQGADAAPVSTILLPGKVNNDDDSIFDLK